MSTGCDACAALTMPVAERFVSINGEGSRSGRLAAFIRFTGCNLSCSWCDTTWAIDGSCPHEDVSVADLVAWVGTTPVGCVTLTGGEPALRPNLAALVEALCLDASWGADCAERVVEIETNGAVDLANLASVRASAERCAATPTRVCFTLDCKLPSSGMASAMRAENYVLLRPDDAVKLVVASNEDLACARSVIDRHGLCARCTVFLSPVFGRIEPAEIVTFMQENQMAAVRLQLQLHKIVWPDQDRGV